MFAPWRSQNPLRIKEESDSGKSFIEIHTPNSRHHKRVSGRRLYSTLGTRGFIFSYRGTLEPTAPDCQPSNAATLSFIYWLTLQQFPVSLSLFYRFHQL